MNWYIIIPVGVLLLWLIVFLVKRNNKDEKAFEKQLNQDYPNATDAPSDIEIEENMH